MGEGVSVVVPVYNSRPTLPTLVERLAATLRPHGPFEVILVNDGSRDGSWEVIRELAAARPEVKGIDLSRNFGQHNALLCGVRYARFPVTLTLDDDLQHPPEEAPVLLAELTAGADVVYGTPRKEAHGVVRDTGSVAMKLVMRHVMGTEQARILSAFRTFRTRLRDGFADYRGPQVSLDVLLSWVASRFVAVPVRHERRRVGRSGYSYRRLAVHAVNVITGFSVMPLRAATLCGFAAALLGIGLLAYVLIQYLIQGGSVPGFPFLASVVVFFAGVQMTALGVIGEYLARMHHRLMERPAYVVREATPVAAAARAAA
jgi:undecaprenyl-phosphate 4-deoxy-4-formamido-L-arabinose transferase